MEPEHFTIRESVRKRRSRAGHMRLALFLASALVIGAFAAIVWMRLPGLNAPDGLPEEAEAATPAPEKIAENATATPTQTESVAPVASPTVEVAQNEPEVDPEVAQDAAPETDEMAVVPAANPLSRPAAPAPVVVAQSVYPTPTSTPLPLLESVEGVVGLGGAELWESSGLLIRKVPQGQLLTIDARSEDGTWLSVETPEGDSGWVRAESMIVFDISRLRRENLVLIPITPTPTADALTAASGSDDTTDGATGGTSGAQGGTSALPRPTPVAGDQPTARVTLRDARLNIRSGPGASYPIITKALPDEVFVLLGKNQAGDWLQIAVPDVEGGFGWVTTQYMSSSVPVNTLPVVDDISSAPPHVEGTYPSAPQPQDGGTGYSGAGAPHALGATIAVEPDGKPTAGHMLYAKPAPVSQPARSVTGLFGKLVIQESWGGNIYVYNLATGELRLLTTGFDPAISPDGSMVVFTRAGGEHGIYLINTDGSNEHVIWTGRELLRSPKFSPDGRYIVFERGDQYILCRDKAGERCRLTPPSPDGNRPERERQPQLARIDIFGGNYQDIPALLFARAPDWNSAGIVYQSTAGIQVTADDPNATTREVFFEYLKQYEMDPDWQPGGGRIVFHRRENSRWELYAVNPDGTGFTPLTKPPITLVEELPSSVAAAWSPDGRHIVFLSNRAPDRLTGGWTAGDWGVWVMDADGGNQRRLPIDLNFTYTFVSEQMLDWGR